VLAARSAVASGSWGFLEGRCLRMADYVTLRGPADGAPAGTRVLELPTLPRAHVLMLPTLLPLVARREHVSALSEAYGHHAPFEPELPGALARAQFADEKPTVSTIIPFDQADRVF